jgi:hypothetical protein
MRAPLAALSIALILAGPAAAGDLLYRLTLDPGGVARRNAPVTAVIPLLVLGGLRLKKPSDFRFDDGEGFRDLFLGRVPIYRHLTAFDPQKREETYKPYLHLYGFHGEGFITKGPGGLYPHHRGIFLGWNKTLLGKRRFDFWHCPDVSQRHLKYLPERELTGPYLARSASLTDWVDGKGTVIVRDRREVTAWAGGEGERVLDFDLTLEAVAGDLRLDGDPQHAGFHFRAAQEVADHQKETVYLLPPGKSRSKDDVVARCPWAACLFKIGGNRYAVLHMSHPRNPPETSYSTRSYGRVGAFFTRDLKVGSPLSLRYRILILDAGRLPELSVESCAGRYREFAEPVQVKVEEKRG